MKRRLAAILAADVVGYSRLVEANEEEAIHTLGIYRETIGALITSHHGRVFGTAGDSIIAEFASPVEAVRCAVNIQRSLETSNSGLPEDRCMRFRIGINLGDVLVEGDDLLGDGVNVAARIEAMTLPGGIDVSGTVYDQVKQKLDVSFEPLGERKVKNIAEPIRTYRVRSQATTVPSDGERQRGRRPWRWALVAMTAASIAVVVTLAWMSPWSPSTEGPADASSDLAIPDGPSIAVLPFTNMSGETEQGYFADGISEDLITDLSKVPGMFVIARNTMFSYKNTTLTTQQVAEDLGVRYVLEGNVRRIEDQVRINVQLADTQTGGLLWAERYDGTFTDVFALQDKITRKIVLALAIELPTRKPASRGGRETTSPEAYDAFLKGWAHYHRGTPEDLAEAIPYLENAVSLDPEFGRAYAALAAVYWESSRRGWTNRLEISADETLQQAEHYLELAMKRPTALGHQVTSQMLSSQGQHEEALAEAGRAIAIDPGDPGGYQAMTNARRAAGMTAMGTFR
jgi:TolB-like protein/class 3 adenylate cyclase